MNDNSGLVYKPNTSSSTIYVNIKGDGTLVKRLTGSEEEKYLTMKEEGLFKVNPKTQLSNEGIQIRQLESGDNKGDTVVEQVYNEISNVQIMDCYKSEYDNRFSLNLVVKSIDNPNAPNVVVSMPYFDGENTKAFSRTFIDRIPNIDINKPITITPCNFTDKKGKTVTCTVLHQEGIKIDSAFTKDKGDKPMAKKDVLKNGKVNWRWEEVGEFQDNILEKFIQKFKDQPHKEEAQENKEEVEMPF